MLLNHLRVKSFGNITTLLDRSQRYSKNYNNSNIGEIMSNVKNIVMEVEEFVWEFFDQDGNSLLMKQSKIKMICFQQLRKLWWNGS